MSTIYPHLPYSRQESYLHLVTKVLQKALATRLVVVQDGPITNLQANSAQIAQRPQNGRHLCGAMGEDEVRAERVEGEV